jgi:hypothetical protein
MVRAMVARGAEPFLRSRRLLTEAMAGHSTSSTISRADKDGYSPLAQLTLGPNGSLYGYTAAGSDGTVFQLVPPAGGSGAWTYQILYVFTGHKDSNLLYESSPLMRRGDSLYGIASGGSKACGAPGCGSVFRLKPPASGTGSWSEKTLYEFVGGTDSGEPNWIAGPDSGGSLYVATSLGNGAVVEVSPPADHGQMDRDRADELQRRY